MKKTVYLTEEQLEKIKYEISSKPSTKLAPFIYDKIKTHRTSLGDNNALPPEEDVAFEYHMLKDRLSDIVDKLSTFDNIERYDDEYLSNRLSVLMRQCVEIERPIRSNLEKICINALLRIFSIPQSTVNINVELVDEITPKHQFRIKPEPASKRKFDFDDIEDFENLNNVILKRRLINALIQGISYVYSTNEDYYADDINSIDDRLIPLYNEIIAINDYLLFIKEEKITDKNPMQSSCVEVELGKKKEKSTINAQGLLFPFLFHELIKGFMELFASHGLPEDNDKAHHILSQSDFLIAEPWDLRIGVNMWKIIMHNYDNPETLPYFFSNLCELPVEEFNYVMKEILAHTKKGQHILNHMIDNAYDDMEEHSNCPMIQVKDASEALIIDDIR